MAKHTITIDATAAGPGTMIAIDGVRVPGVRAYRLEGSTEQLTTLTLEMVNTEVKVTGEVAEVKEVCLR